jgi:hypothetical protein
LKKTSPIIIYQITIISLISKNKESEMKKSRSFRALLLILSMVIFAWGLPSVDAWEHPDLAGGVSTDHRPGKTNPVSNPDRWCLIAQDYLGVATHNYSQHMLQYWNAPVTDYLHYWKSFSGSNNFSVPNCNIEYGPVAAAKGRVITPLKDDAFIAFYTNAGGAIKPVVGYMSAPDWCNYVIPGDYIAGMPWGTFCTIEIATGDIDGAVDENGERHEEIIIAYRKNSKNQGGFSVWITALKYSSTTCFTVLDSIETAGVVGESYSFISLTTGDYDNDGIDEIAVEYPYTSQNFNLCTFDYEKGTLVQKDNMLDGIYAGTNNLVDLTSGDFNGDGHDEIAAIFARCTTDNHDDAFMSAIWINIYKMADASLKIERKSSYCSAQDNWYINKGAAITSGLFKYDPENNYSVARRQLATVELWEHKQDRWQPKIRIFDVNSDFEVKMADAILALGNTGNYPHKWEVACLKPEIAAGRFLTLASPWINDQIAASWGVTPEKGWNSHMVFNVYRSEYDLKLSIPGVQTGYYFNPQAEDFSVYNNTSVPIVAACTEKGKSYYLGTPAHIVIPKILSAVRVIQEPPKHLDYLPKDGCSPDEPCAWEIVNVSKRDDFYASFEESKEKSIETTSTSQTNWGIGGSEEATAQETFEFGIPNIDGGEITLNESEKVSYDYESVTKNLNGHYSSVRFGQKFETSTDDALQLKTMLMDIWRYPVYGLKTTKGLNAFYEVVLPGPATYMTVAGSAVSDYYQPIHENGNLLSYPGTGSGFPTEYDLGKYQVGGQDYTKVMTDPILMSYGGIKLTNYVEWADKDWTEKTTSQQQTLSESADFKVGFKGTASVLIAGGSLSVDLDLSFHNENSWSTSSYSKSATTTEGRVTIEVPAADSACGYPFKPILYTTVDGTLKLAHTVDPEMYTDADFWKTHYHGQPDLSLNLPKKFWWKESNDEEKLGDWYMCKNRQQRSRMRGIFLYTNDPEANKGKEQYLAGSPTAGETIYVQTYVYNYSLDTETGPFVVRFSYAPYNAKLHDGAPDLTTIGEVEVNNLVNRERKEVSVKWDIARDAGGDAPGAGKPYVIYVTLDPDNDVPNEIHELYVEDQSPSPSAMCPIDKNEYSEECGIFCGSNNQGYWPWDSSFMIFAPKTGEENDNEPAVDISIAQKSLEVEFTPESQGYEPYIFTHLPYRLKLKVVANQAVKGFRELLFYDNDKVFSMKRAFGLNPGENDFYSRWTPKEPGEHTLKVVISEDEDDPVPGDAIVTLDVEVLDIKIPPHR